MCQYLWVALGGSNVARGRGFSTCPSSPAHTDLQCQPLITLAREEGSSVWRFHMKFVANLANQTLLLRRLSFLDSTLLSLAFQAFCVQFGCCFISQSLPLTAADNESNSRHMHQLLWMWVIRGFRSVTGLGYHSFERAHCSCKLLVSCRRGKGNASCWALHFRQLTKAAMPTWSPQLIQVPSRICGNKFYKGAYRAAHPHPQQQPSPIVFDILGSQSWFGAENSHTKCLVPQIPNSTLVQYAMPKTVSDGVVSCSWHRDEVCRLLVGDNSGVENRHLLSCRSHATQPCKLAKNENPWVRW